MGSGFARGGAGCGRTAGHATVQGRVVDASGDCACAPSADECSGWTASSHVWRDMSTFASGLAMPSSLSTVRRCAASMDKPGSSGDAVL